MSDLYEPHDGSHQNCAPCFAIKIRTVQFQGMEAGTRRNEDKSRARDMDEYKKDGIGHGESLEVTPSHRGWVMKK